MSTYGKAPWNEKYIIGFLDSDTKCLYALVTEEDILKEYVAEEKLKNAMDTFGSCLDEAKYAVFEQGFLRGIAAMKGGNI